MSARPGSKVGSSKGSATFELAWLTAARPVRRNSLTSRRSPGPAFSAAMHERSSDVIVEGERGPMC